MASDETRRAHEVIAVQVYDLRHVPPNGLVEQIAARLDRGEVGILPTETVLGLCASAEHPQAVERVYALKHRARSQRLPLLVSDAAAVPLPGFPHGRSAQRLAAGFWPGPLTLVLGDAAGVAYRVPRHEFTRAVLRAARFPVHATSANTSGSQAPTTSDDIDPVLLAGVDFAVLDAPAAVAMESTIIRVTPEGHTTLLRSGAISAAATDECLRYRVLILCTGNTCRSPMAEVALRAALVTALGTPSSNDPSGFEVRSAGIMSGAGCRAATHAIDVCAADGLDLSRHRSRPAEVLVPQADLILGMSEEHLAAVSRMGLQQDCQLALFDRSGGSIADPIGGPKSEYGLCLQRIRRAASLWANELAQIKGCRLEIS